MFGNVNLDILAWEYLILLGYLLGDIYSAILMLGDICLEIFCIFYSALYSSEIYGSEITSPNSYSTAILSQVQNFPSLHLKL